MNQQQPVAPTSQSPHPASQQHPHLPGYAYPTQQKRQASVSNYHTTSKRSPNRYPAPTPDPEAILQSSAPPAEPEMTPPTTAFPPRGPFQSYVPPPAGSAASAVFGKRAFKTSTPSPYDIPSSPPANRNQPSDSSDSTPADANTPTDGAYGAAYTAPAGYGATSSSGAGFSAYETPQGFANHPARGKPQQNPGSGAPAGNPGGDPPPSRTMSDEEQQLATKLKETYKNIVNYEEVVQKHCIEITIKINHLNSGSGSPSEPPQGATATASRTSQLSNDLWTIYHHNLSLLNNYHDFLVTALKPSSNATQFRTGKNIVELYKIPRRMWVYGVVGFLEVLKNIMAIFADHEICSCFIAYCFNIISNLTDPVLEMEGWWSEKLGDLSRMAIALYASKFIDWKIAAESWYAVAMKTLYGHGKIYYHMCTVQSDNLDALVNIGKSVICRDPFVPTPHYLRLVVENICTQRNILSLLELPIIDFIKIHKVLLSIHPGTGDIHDSQVQYGVDLVTRYGLTFGSDTAGYNFFTREVYDGQGDYGFPHGNSGYPAHLVSHPSGQGSSMEKLNFWLHKGPAFAIANINHMAGFGDAKNPLAKLFGLPEALKERKDKKERKRKSRPSPGPDKPFADGALVTAAELAASDWFYCLQYINRSAWELGVRVLGHYLVGPKQASTGHVLVWLYFLVAVGNAVKQHPAARPMATWLMHKLFPWELMIAYLNQLLGFVQNNPQLSRAVAAAVAAGDVVGPESLPEVWKCWGTLWFDQVSEKGDYRDCDDAHVNAGSLFDLPVCGNYGCDGQDPRKRRQVEADSDHRIVRILNLARSLADDYPLYGLVRTVDGFAYDESHCQVDSVDHLVQATGAPEVTEHVARFLQTDRDPRIALLVEPVQASHLVSGGGQSPAQVDHVWFGRAADTPQHRSDEIVDVDDDGYADSEPEDDYYYQSYDPGAPPDPVSGNLGDHMDSAITYVTLDTNIWLKHCGRVFKCVRNSVFKVSIPLIVFQELRALRKSAETTIADAATRSVIIIRELYLTRQILPLRFDGTVASDINETTEFENNSNWRSSVDETILNAVNEHDEIGKKLMKGHNQPLASGTVLTAKTAKVFRYCILITDDRNMRLRAKTIGLTSFQSKWLFTQLESVFPDQCID
ncbi:EST/SMG-like protein 1 [Diutina catenulata]